MDNAKPIQFNITAGGYFVVFLVTAISGYIPLLGWAFGFNYASNWIAENTMVNGKQVVYKAGFGETLKFLFINILLLVITLGIYVFWFVPKCYRYVADHISYVGTEPTVAPTPAPAPDPAAVASPDVPTPVSVSVSPEATISSSDPTPPPAAPLVQ